MLLAEDNARLSEAAVQERVVQIDNDQAVAEIFPPGRTPDFAKPGINDRYVAAVDRNRFSFNEISFRQRRRIFLPELSKAGGRDVKFGVKELPELLPGICRSDF